MPLDSGDIRPKPQFPVAPPPEQEHLPCPRCDSTNTKFCYYNNYNFSQPRHFCKSCRRYWTHGGTLRDIPVGGGSRKNAKRSRTITSVSSGISAHDHHHTLPSATAILVPASVQFGNGSGGEMKPGGTFTSLLNTPGPGFLALGGFGLGIGSGYEDIGFGIGRGVWPFPVVGDVGGNANNGGGGGGGGNILVNPWQLESGEGGFVGSECFLSWPDLAISTPGNGLK